MGTAREWAAGTAGGAARDPKRAVGTLANIHRMAPRIQAPRGLAAFARPPSDLGSLHNLLPYALRDLMFDWLRRRRLSNEAKRKLLIAAARAEEAIVETHVANVLDLLDSLGSEVDVDRALELYAEMLPMDEHVAATVTNRVLARHDAPAARRPAGPSGRYGGVFRDDVR
jgi:hypothetical protein